MRLPLLHPQVILTLGLVYDAYTCKFNLMVDFLFTGNDS